MDTERCDHFVFTHGVSMGLFDMPKEDAEKYCKAETARTGWKHDWRYAAGRVHVLALIPKEKEYSNLFGQII